MNHKEALQFAESHPEEAAQAQEAYKAILSRSATDLDFRQQLLADPAAAISAFTGKPVPASFNVAFIENRADATVVLPDYIDPSSELNEEELEAVAGGEFLVGGAVLAVGAVVVAVLTVADRVQTHENN